MNRVLLLEDDNFVSSGWVLHSEEVRLCSRVVRFASFLEERERKLDHLRSVELSEVRGELFSEESLDCLTSGRDDEVVNVNCIHK